MATNSERIQYISDNITSIANGKLYLEDFYKDNGTPKRVGDGNFTQEKYDKFLNERKAILTNYRTILTDMSKDKTFTLDEKTAAQNVIKNVLDPETNNTSKIEVRFATFPRRN